MRASTLTLTLSLCALPLAAQQGDRGVFATRIAYVSVDGAPPSQRYQLLIADAESRSNEVCDAIARLETILQQKKVTKAA